MNINGNAMKEFEETHARVMKLANESIAFNQQRIEEADQRWKANSKTSITPPVVTHVEYVSPTVAELYEARLNRSPVWDKHMEQLAKEYDQK